MKQNILVVGGNGTVGAGIVEILKSQGHSVRVTSSKGGNGQAKVNLLTGEGLRDAFEGIDRAFFLSPAGYADQHAVLSPLIQEAKRRGLKKVVLMSAMGANAVPTSPLRRAEVELEKSGLTYNIIRPNWFLQNFNSFWISGILGQGKILLPAGTAKVSFIDARDISAVAATLLISDERNNRDFDLTGPEAVDHATVAKAISEVTGKQITYQEISPSDLKAGLLGAGLSEAYADFLLVIFGALREGYASPVNRNVEELTGKKPIGVQQYAADFKAAWL